MEKLNKTAEGRKVHLKFTLLNFNAVHEELLLLYRPTETSLYVSAN